ncbi:MAG: SRPBCC family protein [Geminicoccaceae bacterium]
MTGRNVSHSTIVIERTYSAMPSVVFHAWADPDARDRWDVPGGDWEMTRHSQDFRVGGIERVSFGPPGGDVYHVDTRYEDIVADSRIIFSYTVAHGDKRISASVTTVELLPEAHGTKLILTEQAAFLDGGDTASDRQQGWQSILEKLDAALQSEGAGPR